MSKHPVPKKKTSSSKRDMRRSHHALALPVLSECPQCHAQRLQHHICPSCGYYEGQPVLKV